MASASDGSNKGAGPRGSKINKPEKVQLASDIIFIHLSVCSNFCRSILTYCCKLAERPFHSVFLMLSELNLDNIIFQKQTEKYVIRDFFYQTIVV